MTKTEIIEQVARKARMPKRAAAEAIEIFLDEIARTLSKGEKVVISGFGTYYPKRIAKKTVKIPNRDEYVTVKAHRTAGFTPGKRLKRQVAR